MRILRMLILVLTAAGVVTAATITSITSTNDINTLNNDIVTAAKKNFGFMTGSGNVVWVNTSEFLGLKIGVGLGVAGNVGFLSLVSAPQQVASFDTLVSLVPAPYDMLYGKIGLPGFIPFLEKSDIGFRIGALPSMTVPLSGGFTFVMRDIFSFGLELRKTLFELPAGLIRIDARVAYNYSKGTIGIRYETNISTVLNSVEERIDWSGNNITARAVAGINIPVIFSAFAGIGPDLNFGGIRATSSLSTSGSFTIAGTTFATAMSTSMYADGAYDPFDIRVIGGIRLFVVDVAVEYGLLSGGLSAFIGASLVF